MIGLASILKRLELGGKMEKQNFDLILKNGTVVLPSGITKADIAVRGGMIVDIGDLSGVSAERTEDCTGLHVLPGVIDSQVHFREPGLVHKEDLDTGTLSAIAGGVTTIFEMPNTNPLTTTREAMEEKFRLAEEKSHCNYAFFVGGTAENAEQLPELEKMSGCCGVKIFMGSSTGNLLSAEDEVIENILSHGTRRVAVHAEDEFRLKERYNLVEGGADVSEHPVWRDEETAINATKRILRLSKKTGRRVHVLHITTAEEMDLLAEHKDLATVEVTPQHLSLFAPECYERLGSYAQMNPPIRSKEHQEGLWRAIQNGVVDVIGSDHAPHTCEEKDQPYPKSPSGMPGVQTTVPIMLDHVNQGKLSLERFVDLMCAGPARIYNIAKKGRIVVGYDADFTVVDMKANRLISNNWIKSKSGWTPFDGVKVTAWPVITIVQGMVCMKEDEISTYTKGYKILFNESF